MRRCSLVLLVVKFAQTKDRGEREEEQHGVEENKPRYAEPTNIYSSS